MKRVNIDREWEFVNGKPRPAFFGNSGPVARSVNLPHDFTIETDPIPTATGEAATGYYDGGLGTYTKMLSIPYEYQDRRVLVEFDGSYMNTVVELNGQAVALHHYGYTPFHADLTPYIKPGKQNRLAVTVNNTAQPNSRWYSGSGIYRHVDLLDAPSIHIAPWGIFAYTSHVVKGTAHTIVETTVENHSDEAVNYWVEVKVEKDSTDNVAASGRTIVHVPAGEKAVARIKIAVENADFWDIDSPNLYDITAQLTDGKTILDGDTTTFGIRTISVDVKNGFMLNGRSTKLMGGCIHHDNGILGAASFKDSEYRKMKAHKDNGYNAIRCAHNPPSRDMLDACDRLGLLVMNEAFDCWVNAKNTNDYSLYFKENWKSDMEAFILRDRNHPSIIMWSTGNEITERAGLSDGYEWAAKLAEYVRVLDPTRLVTNGVCSLWSGLDDEERAKSMEENRKLMELGATGTQNMDSAYGVKIWGDYTEAFNAPLDVVGYNYLEHRYERDGEQFPNRVICGTESFPKEIDRIWDIVERFPHVIGDFTWTSYDYLGEAGIGKCTYVESDVEVNRRMMIMGRRSEYPWRLANDSDFDICGFERPQLAYRRIVWGSDETYIAVRNPSYFGMKEIITPWGWPECDNIWNWEGFEGKSAQIDVYSSAEEVELILNGKSIGRRAAGKANRYTAKFEITYEPGTLEAISYTAGNRVSSNILKTAGKPTTVCICIDKNELKADGQSLAYAVIEFVDAEGNRVPNAEIKTTAKADGAGSLAAFGIARPKTTENYTKGEFTSYQGRLLAIIRAGYETGVSELTVCAEGFNSVSTTIIIN